jgi:hypothetical protein
MLSAPSCPLVIIKFRAHELGLEFPAPSDNLNQSTAKSIYNAWMETTMIDNHGSLWILPDRLGEILRTSKSNARFIQGKIRDEHKKVGAEGTYLRYSEVNKILTNIIQSAGSIKRESYAEYSESIGRSIRDSDKAKLLKHHTYESIKAAKAKLKSTRIKQFKIFTDELTNVPLTASSQFSHIRSCSVYPQFAASVWNGLIVNRNTHQIITHNEINDEDRLLELCREEKWNTKWHQEFVGSLAELN